MCLDGLDFLFLIVVYLNRFSCYPSRPGVVQFKEQDMENVMYLVPFGELQLVGLPVGSYNGLDAE